jgi:hypothetical protein
MRGLRRGRERKEEVGEGVSSVETGKEITRVPCVREMLDAKIPDSELRSRITPDGTRTLTGVRIKGEMVSHRIVN